MRIVVTGGCGFIGSHIVDQLIANNHEVAVIDNLSTGYIEYLNPKARLYNIDILSDDIKEVFGGFKPTVVYHQAAQIDIQKSTNNPCFDAETNIKGTINVLECCRTYGVRKIIYASSAAVYGNPKYLPVDESHPVEPISFYGISKHTPEHYIKSYADLYGIKYSILRYANAYGVRQLPKGEGGVISIFISKMLNGESPTVYGDGEQTRDFIYVKDIASANVSVLSNGDNKIYNVSTRTSISINSLVNILKDILSTNLEVYYGSPRPSDIIHSYLDNNAIYTDTGWVPKYSLEEGLRETVEYYKKR